jgi:hypothetical protein
MPDDHSKLAPLLPISNRTVKRLCADDSAGSRVKVGHCQALTAVNAQSCDWAFSSPLRGSSDHQVVLRSEKKTQVVWVQRKLC